MRIGREALKRSLNVVMASNVLSKRPLPSGYASSAVDGQSSLDTGEPSSKKSKADDSWDIDATMIAALEEEEQMIAETAGRPHPQTTPTRAVKLTPNPTSRREWLRPPPPPIDPTADTVSFQQIDMDHYVGNPILGMPGLQGGPVPVLRMYGVTMDGNSVCAHLHGFLPYFYVNLPCAQFAPEHCSDFRASLNSAVLGDMRSNKEGISTAVVSVEICER